jgi:IQ calmodulin-binding motif
MQMDDDETILSAYAFIETVAAIVIQTAVRQFLATLRVDSLRQTHESLALASKIRSIESKALFHGRLPHSDDDTRALRPAADRSTRQVALEEGNDSGLVSEGDLDDIALSFYHLAAVQIQSVFRGFWIRDCLDVDHYCTTVLQRAYRGYSCRKRVQHDIKRIITVQSWWRRNIARDNAAHILAYAIAIQAVFRGHRVRKRFKRHIAQVASAKWSAATIIQWIWRGYIVRKRYRMYLRSETQVRRAAAVAIQSRWRAFVCEANFIRTLVDVLITQTIVRRWLAQNRVAAAKTRALRLKESHQAGRTARPMARQLITGQQKTVSAATVNAQEQANHGESASKASANHQSALPSQKPSQGALLKSRDVEKTVVCDASSRRSVLGTSDPPGHASGNQQHTTEKKPSVAVKSRDAGIKSRVVAYPMSDEDENELQPGPQKGGEVVATDSTTDSTGVREMVSVAGTTEDTADASNEAGAQTSDLAIEPSSAGPTSNLFSIWKEKEKKNACGMPPTGNGVSKIYRKG